MHFQNCTFINLYRRKNEIAAHTCACVLAPNKHIVRYDTCITNGAKVLSTERVLTSIIFGSSIIEAAKLNLNVVDGRPKQFCFTILEFVRTCVPLCLSGCAVLLPFVLIKFWEFQSNPQLYDILGPQARESG